MNWNLCTIDWIAIGSIATAAMAIATFRTLRNNKKQFVELQKQSQVMQKQSFENTLFQLLHEVKKILSEVSNIPPEGERFADFRYGLSALESEYKILQSLGTGKTNEEGDELRFEANYDNIQNSYSERYNNMSNLGAYFRSLYRIIKYINESGYSTEEKYQYTSFVRAQLTDIELLWLFYNCTVGFGQDKFKPLLEKWTVLKNMPKNRLISEEHLQWIGDSAFERKTTNT